MSRPVISSNEPRKPSAGSPIEWDVHEQMKYSRPWGTYEVLYEGDGYKVKRLVVDPGHRTSRQRHLYRSEHWYVVAGIATVKTLTTKQLSVKESVDIAAGEWHQLCNETSNPLVVIEIMYGPYTGEDDIQREELDRG